MAEVRGTNNNDLLEGTIDNDDVFGYKGKDEIFGGDGDDFIVGHEGKDQLTGGSGADEFVFAFKSDLKSKNVDKIVDFNPAEGDTILLSYKVFKHMGFGPLKAEFFHVGKKAADKDDHIIYDDKKHALFYDSDGKGGDDQVKFAGFTYDIPFIGSGSVDPIVSFFLTSFLEADVGLPV